MSAFQDMLGQEFNDFSIIAVGGTRRWTVPGGIDILDEISEINYEKEIVHVKRTYCPALILPYIDVKVSIGES